MYYFSLLKIYFLLLWGHLKIIGYNKMRRTSEDAAQNSQQYTITDNSGFIEASGAFIYRGYLISFSTMGYNRMITRTPVLVISNNGNGSIEKDFDTIESAIININSWLDTK